MKYEIGNKNKKIYLSLLISIIIINSVLLYVLIKKEKTVWYEGNKLIYQERKNGASIFKDNDGNILTVKPVNVVLDDELIVTDDEYSSYEITYKDKNIFYDNSKFMDLETKITLSNGSVYESTPVSVDYYNEQSNELPDDVKLSYDVINVHKSPKGILGHLGDIILSIISIVIGFINLMYPGKLWRFEHRLDVKGGEPTDFAIICSRVTGIVLIFIPTLLVMVEILKM